MQYSLVILTVFLFFATKSSVLATIKQIKTEINAIDSLPESKNTVKAESYNKLAYRLWESANYELAVDVFNKSVVVNQNIGNENALKNIYTNIGMIYTDKEEYESALLFFRKSLVIREELNDAKDIASELINISICLQHLGRHYQAIKKIDQALELAKTINDMYIIRRCYGVLAESYEKVGEAKKSMEYFGLYATIDRHIQTKTIEQAKHEASKKVTEANVQVQLAKREKKATEQELKETERNLEKTQKLSKLQQAKLKIQEFEIRERDAIIQHKILLNKLYIGGISISLLIIFLVYRNYKLKKTTSEKLTVQNAEILNQQKIIKKKNESITQSISYAQRIQDAMLPSIDSLQERIPESFVFFKPRDVVSGDFYWFATDKTESAIVDCQRNDADVNEHIFIAAADCTGHGVPGAFMSMIGFNLLNEIVGKKIYEPQQILKALNIGVKNALKQDKTQNSDGMDICLCRIDTTNNVVDFSGAINPLIYIKDGEMHEIEGGLFPVGGDEFDLGIATYSEGKILVDAPTTFYMFSDGFQDQFGGERGVKFMSHKFKKFLFKIHEKPMPEQKQLLSEALISWMGNFEQVDDILIIGFRIG